MRDELFCRAVTFLPAQEGADSVRYGALFRICAKIRGEFRAFFAGVFLACRRDSFPRPVWFLMDGMKV